MPTYSFICPECGERFDRLISYQGNPNQQVCPNGHVNVRRIYSVPGIVFKGNGFYSTDNRIKPKEPSK